MTEIIPNGTGSEVREDINNEFTKLEAEVASRITDVVISANSSTSIPVEEDSIVQIWDVAEGTDSNAKALFHFDESTIIDSTNTITASVGTTLGNTLPVLVTNNLKFGTSSLHFANTSDSLYLSANSIFDFATNGGGFDFWLYIAGVRTANGYVCATGADGNGFGMFYNTSVNGLHLTDLGKSDRGYFACSLNTWHHIECNWLNGTFRFFIGGVMQTSFSNPFPTHADVPFSLGALGGITNYSTYGTEDMCIDEFRVFDSTQSHTANFTPLSKAYEAQKQFVLNTQGYTIRQCNKNVSITNEGSTNKSVRIITK